MKDTVTKDIPFIYETLLSKSEEIGFNMPSDLQIGSLLKTLIRSKPSGRFLEIVTGIGLSLSWMIDGMDKDAEIISIDNNPQLIEIVKSCLPNHPSVHILCADGTEWIHKYRGAQFDLIFADAWA